MQRQGVDREWSRGHEAGGTARTRRSVTWHLNSLVDGATARMHRGLHVTTPVPPQCPGQQPLSPSPSRAWQHLLLDCCKRRTAAPPPRAARCYWRVATRHPPCQTALRSAAYGRQAPASSHHHPYVHPASRFPSCGTALHTPFRRQPYPTRPPNHQPACLGYIVEPFELLLGL